MRDDSFHRSIFSLLRSLRITRNFSIRNLVYFYSFIILSFISTGLDVIGLSLVVSNSKIVRTKF